MKKSSLFKTSILAIAIGVAMNSGEAFGQIFLSQGPYSQNFDSLPSSGNVAWAQNSTLPGWYSADGRNFNGAGTSVITGGFGTSTTGSLYSFGTNNINVLTERALGSLSSGTPTNIAFGIRFTNDTGVALTNFTVSYTGEQWRNGNNATPQTLAFSYRIANSPIENTDPMGILAAWTPVTALSFVSPIANASAALALEGNNATNRTAISATISGIVVLSGQEIFFRWLDINDAGNDHALAVDDLTVSFQTNLTASATKPTISINPVSVTLGSGKTANFSVTAGGTEPLFYQWYTNDTSGGLLSGAITPNLQVPYLSTAMSGSQYFVIITNVAGSATSSVAILTVTNIIPVVTNIHYLHTLRDANFKLNDTNTLFQIEGIVTTPGNLVAPFPASSFFIQDASGGMDVFFRGGFGFNAGVPVPTLGQHVRVTGPLDQFAGLVELHPDGNNATHNIEILDGGVAQPLPAPTVFTFSSGINPVTMEDTFEGARVVVSNVFLGTDTGTVTGDTNIFMTNLTGQVFILKNPVTITGPQGSTPPSFASSVVGVMTQNSGAAVPTNGYYIMLLDSADITAGTPPVTSPVLSIELVGTNVVLTWTGSFYLKSSTNVVGPYDYEPDTVNPATTPYTVPATNSAKFFRLISDPPPVME